MKNKLIYFVLALSIILLCFFFLINHHYKKIDFQNNNSVEILINSTLQNNITYSSYVYLSYYENRKYLNLDTLPKLIYRYHEFSCEACINKDLSLICDLKKEIGKEKILLLPAYEFSRNNTILLKNKLIDFEYINIPSEVLNIPKDKEGSYKNYFFIINNQKEMHMLFFPSIDDTYSAEFYINIVKKILM